MGGACELLCAYVHARECVKIFTVQKKKWRKISPMACIGETGKNFHVYGMAWKGVPYGLYSHEPEGSSPEGEWLY